MGNTCSSDPDSKPDSTTVKKLGEHLNIKFSYKQKENIFTESNTIIKYSSVKFKKPVRFARIEFDEFTPLHVLFYNETTNQLLIYKNSTHVMIHKKKKQEYYSNDKTHISQNCISKVLVGDEYNGLESVVFTPDKIPLIFSWVKL
jgi:hypothetical protein